MPKILVVEDDNDLRFLYDTILSRQGHEVVSAVTTSDGIQKLTSNLVDLVILDINMPDLPGFKLIEYSHNDVRLKHVPIVVVSANERFRDTVHSLGVPNFLVKPVPMRQLISIVDMVLKSASNRVESCPK
jgi:DNA-binding response OmpR family regulator